MEAEFIKIEKMNNGIFIIDILENLFKEIDLNEKLISYVLTYIKKKTQKVKLTTSTILITYNI